MRCCANQAMLNQYVGVVGEAVIMSQMNVSLLRTILLVYVFSFCYVQSGVARSGVVLLCSKLRIMSWMDGAVVGLPYVRS